MATLLICGSPVNGTAQDLRPDTDLAKLTTQTEAAKVVTRKYQIDPKRARARLPDVSPPTPEPALEDALRTLLVDKGATLAKSDLFFNTRLNELVVRATRRDMAIIEPIVAGLAETPPKTDLAKITAQTQATQVVTRKYQIDPKRAQEQLPNLPPGTAKPPLEEALRSLLIGRGAVLTKDNLFFNTRLNELVVRATRRDLATIEPILAGFAARQPDVLIEVGAAEFSGDIPMFSGLTFKLGNTNLFTRVWTEQQFQFAQNIITERGGTLRAPSSIVTVSGQPGRIEFEQKWPTLSPARPWTGSTMGGDMTLIERGK